MKTEVATMVTAFAICLLPIGCSKESQAEPRQGTVAQPEQPAPAPAVPSPAMAAATAKKLFSMKCLVCHGDSGNGDGPGAAALTPKPRAFIDGKWQDSVTDDQLAKTIIEGGAAVGKSPAMPGNPDLADKPDVVKELIAIVRGFKKA